MLSKLLIRVDASAEIGVGHVMRCLAVAQIWQENGEVEVLAAQMPAVLRERLRNEGVRVSPSLAAPGSTEDARCTCEAARACGARWVLVDGYRFGSQFQRLLRDAGLKVACIDDFGQADHYFADIVINPNAHSDAALYSHRESGTELLLGTAYALLRREFLAKAEPRVIPEVASNVLVTIGGGDPANVTATVLQAIDGLSLEGIAVKVAIGPANPNLRKLQDLAARTTVPLQLVENADMPALMAWADLAVSAAGVTTWELLLMGVPTLLVIAAENQRGNAERLQEWNVALNLGWHDALDVPTVSGQLRRIARDRDARAAMIEAGRGLVDGHGAHRVGEAMRTHADIEIRRATQADRRMLFEWANDPEVRRLSFTTDPIVWDEHCRWFDTKMEQPGCHLLIACEHDTPIGQVRFDVENEMATISISIAREFRDRGFGSRVIKLAVRRLFNDAAVSSVAAWIKDGNDASVRAFRKAGFLPPEMAELGGVQAMRMVLRREDVV